MTTIVHRFWLTAEADAWSRDFTHEDYIDLKTKRGDTSTPLTEEGYVAFCSFMDDEMSRTL